MGIAYAATEGGGHGEEHSIGERSCTTCRTRTNSICGLWGTCHCRKYISLESIFNYQTSCHDVDCFGVAGCRVSARFPPSGRGAQWYRQHARGSRCLPAG